MNTTYYILDGKKPVPVDDSIVWDKWFDNRKNWIVDKTTIGDSGIDTVFLGINHRDGEGEPILFETMIFGGDEDGYQERYCTWDEAVEGHKFACEKVSAKQ